MVGDVAEGGSVVVEAGRDGPAGGVAGGPRVAATAPVTKAALVALRMAVDSTCGTVSSIERHPCSHPDRRRSPPAC